MKAEGDRRHKCGFCGDTACFRPQIFDINNAAHLPRVRPLSIDYQTERVRAFADSTSQERSGDVMCALRQPFLALTAYTSPLWR